jgi:dipeptidyl aminopeptidase/acylaminoacyl peptidase
VLASLVTQPDVFSAGTSSYGVSDLAKLAEDTHKFESRYLEKLVGGTYEQVPDLYRDRSPVHHADSIKTPLLVSGRALRRENLKDLRVHSESQILQGSIDAVVPPNQAEAILEKVKAKGRRVEYVLFEGEGHGWRKAENVKRALETELAFYEDVLGLRA